MLVQRMIELVLNIVFDNIKIMKNCFESLLRGRKDMGLEFLRDEVKKCILVCANYHGGDICWYD